MAGAAAALGDVPELLSAVQLATQGPDERTTLLYAAFLCRALLEASADDRAATTLQRAWRAHRARQPGTACAMETLNPLVVLQLTCDSCESCCRAYETSTRWRSVHGGLSRLCPLPCTMGGQLSHDMLPSAGYARQHLHAWAAAARAISLAYGRRLDRRALGASLAAIRRGLAAAVRVQALWRARRPRRDYQRLLHAVRRSQVSTCL